MLAHPSLILDHDKVAYAYRKIQPNQKKILVTLRTLRTTTKEAPTVDYTAVLKKLAQHR